MVMKDASSLPELLTDGGSDDTTIDVVRNSSEAMYSEVNELEEDFWEWNESRTEREASLWESKSSYDAELSEKAVKLENRLDRVQDWAERPIEEKPVYENNPERGSYSFSEYENLGLASFMGVLSEEAGKAHRRYRSRGEKIIELNEQLDKLDREDIEETLDKSGNRNISLSDTVRSRLSRFKDSDYQNDEIRGSKWEGLLSRQRVEKKQELEQQIEYQIENSKDDRREFLRYFDEVEDAYSSYVSDVESYIDQTVTDLDTTVNLFETLSGIEVPDLEEEVGLIPEEHGKLVEDREQEVREKYEETLDAVEERAREQYNYIEGHDHLDNALAEVKEVESRMEGEYFEEIKRSRELEEKVQNVYAKNIYIDDIRERSRDPDLN